ncbi:hypothetical protein BU23DRAFT_577801 [Bimuria novae-zelandiae CBS 107.79]|uniref:Aminoglycoside phosphotransferase domain-containing protein n=1 Tax=Bimuria novae-zelandiae CBS 107.79 TaxID=1447943 RepID=A0A6A5VXG9_9PLEO|nr:hypothetical protein BU23DRAFT_577801 [Bimuria novae-zelandiae CBS 107.79]
MNRFRGENYVIVRPSLTRDKRLNTVHSLARFSWQKGKLASSRLANMSAISTECYASDLNEMNILVDPDSGEITVVVDWTGASILPFGFALYALESALGSMGSSGWIWFDNVDDLRDTFWKAFREQTGLSNLQTRLIKLAGKAGILIRYGTAYDSGLSGMIGVRDSNTEDFTYLDALLF